MHSSDEWKAKYRSLVEASDIADKRHADIVVYAGQILAERNRLRKKARRVGDLLADNADLRAEVERLRAELSKNPGELASPPPACEGERRENGTPEQVEHERRIANLCFVLCLRYKATACVCDEIRRHFPKPARASQAERERDQAAIDRDYAELLLARVVAIPGFAQFSLSTCLNVKAFLSRRQGESREVPVPVEPCGRPRADVARGEPGMPGSQPSASHPGGTVEQPNGQRQDAEQASCVSQAEAPAAVATLASSDPGVRQLDETQAAAVDKLLNEPIHPAVAAAVAQPKARTADECLDYLHELAAWDHETYDEERDIIRAELSALRQRVAEAERLVEQYQSGLPRGYDAAPQAQETSK